MPQANFDKPLKHTQAIEAWKAFLCSLLLYPALYLTAFFYTFLSLDAYIIISILTLFFIQYVIWVFLIAGIVFGQIGCFRFFKISQWVLFAAYVCALHYFAILPFKNWDVLGLRFL